MVIFLSFFETPELRHASRLPSLLIAISPSKVQSASAIFTSPEPVAALIL